jgi:hypothetical protein
MRYKSLTLTAAALLAGVLGWSGAQSANVMTGSGAPVGIIEMPDANVQEVKRRYWRHGGHRYGGYRYRGYHHYDDDDDGDFGGVWLGLGLLPFFGSGYYGGYGGYSQPYYYSGGRAHVRWCLNHKRTYDVRSDTFMGYDGYRHRCRSPYRY